MGEKSLKIVRCIDFIFLSTWAIFWTLRVFFPPIKSLTSNLWIILLIVDFIVTWVSRAYKPIERHLKQELLRFLLVVIPLYHTFLHRTRCPGLPFRSLHYPRQQGEPWRGLLQSRTGSIAVISFWDCGVKKVDLTACLKKDLIQLAHFV